MPHFLRLCCQERNLRGLGANEKKKLQKSGLILAGIELIFFIVAGLGLYFGLVLEVVFVILGIFCIAEQSLHKVKAFSASYSPHQ